MRNAYCRMLHKIMAKDPSVFALTADIGFRNFDAIRRDFPERFINVGVAESNMIGVAAGLTLSGKKVFVFTLAPFVTMRCFEQIRVDLCYQQLPVKIIGAGGGFVYGHQGTTHHAVEDVGILRTLPHMNIICPVDPIETSKAVKASMDVNGPVYIRIGRNNEPVLHEKDYTFKMGESVLMCEGHDVTIIGSGTILKNALDAAAALKHENISVRVINMHTIKPIDRKRIIESARETKVILTIEEHSIIGGLGSAVAEVLAEEACGVVKFKRLGLNDVYCRIHADYLDLQKEHNLCKDAIGSSIKHLLKMR